MGKENERDALPDKDSVWDPKSGTKVKKGTVAPLEGAGDPSTLKGSDIDDPEGSAREAEAGNWKDTEVVEGTTAPIEKAGSVEIPIEDPDQKDYAKEEADFEGEKAGVESETLDTGKKVRGHKTKSGL